MDKNKVIQAVAFLAILMGLYYLSLVIGEWTAGKDIRFCQMIIYSSMAMGFFAILLFELIAKKYPLKK